MPIQGVWRVCVCVCVYVCGRARGERPTHVATHVATRARAANDPRDQSGCPNQIHYHFYLFEAFASHICDTMLAYSLPVGCIYLSVDIR